jgi:transglutaminase-like putative cysteine protease
VLTVSLVFAVQILAFTGVALAFLLAVTLSEASHGGHRPPLQEPGVPGWARRVEWGRLLRRVREATDWRVVALGAGLFAALVAVSALLFLAIPRFQLENSFFLERFITKKARTGFSDTVRFGDVTEIQQDNSVALSVDVSNRARVPAVPYWRMMVLDDYREGTFRLSAGLRRTEFTREFTRATVAAGRGNTGEQDYWTFYLESGVSRYLPLLGRFEELRFREAQRFRLAPELGIVALRDDPVTMTAYRVAGMETGGALRDEEFARRWRRLANSPRATMALMLRLGVDEADREVLRRLVAEIEAGGGGGISAEEFARRADAWLAGRHAYSLQPRIPAGRGDPLVRWLASSEGGHCELFAGSLVLLARAAGFPARVVTGFKGGTWNGYSNNFTLRNSDAHAWCEVFDAASGSWLRNDPTPGAAAAADGAAGESALARRVDRSWGARWDSLRIFWYRRIVNFDQGAQVETLKAVKEATTQSGRRLREALRRFAAALKGWLAKPWKSGAGALEFVAIVVALAGAVWAARNFRFSVFDFRFAGAKRRGDAVRAEAGRWLRRLRAVRATRAEKGEGRKEKEEGVFAELQRLRFGAGETWREPREIFREARREWRAARNVRRI